MRTLALPAIPLPDGSPLLISDRKVPLQDLMATPDDVEVWHAVARSADEDSSARDGDPSAVADGPAPDHTARDVAPAGQSGAEQSLAISSQISGAAG